MSILPSRTATIVDSIPCVVGPASMTSEMCPSSSSRTCFAVVGLMNNERCETRPSLCSEKFGDRNRVQRVGGKSVNSFGRQRDHLAVAQQFNRRVAVG